MGLFTILLLALLTARIVEWLIITAVKTWWFDVSDFFSLLIKAKHFKAWALSIVIIGLSLGVSLYAILR